MGKYSIVYLFWGLWIKTGMWLFQSRFKMYGNRKQLWKSPVILAPNHQNAFVDALVVILPIVEWKQLSFMVRQDAFNNKIGGMILRSMKLFPAYRMRDGYENLSKNEETFNHCFKLLNRNDGMIIFPEANHAIPRKIRPLKKGLMRIALQAESQNNFEMGLKVIPVGINYSDPHEAGGNVCVILGEPLDMTQYQGLYAENPAKAQNAMKKDLEAAMKPLAIHIEDKEAYEQIETILSILNNEGPGRYADLKDQFHFSKKAVEHIERHFEITNPQVLIEKATAYQDLKKKVGIRDWMLRREGFSIGEKCLYGLKWLVLLPFFVLIFPIGWFPFSWPHAFAKKKIKDAGFRSSITFGLALVIYTVIILIGAITALFFVKWYWVLMSIPVILICTKLAHWFMRTHRRLMAMFKYNSLLKAENKDLLALRKIRQDIVQEVGVPK